MTEHAQSSIYFWDTKENQGFLENFSETGCKLGTPSDAITQRHQLFCIEWTMHACKGHEGVAKMYLVNPNILPKTRKRR